MKKRYSLLLLQVLILALSSFDNKSVVNHPMPLMQNKTVEGMVIDEDYYKGHVTIVSFMYIGCPPCMVEISTLNKLKESYSTDKRLQVLCIARQMKEQMLQFNSTSASVYSKIRQALGADSIRYLIQPACSNEKSTAVTDEGHMELKSECNIIEEKYGVTAYPTIFFVDKKGMVRKIDVGGPQMKNDTAFYNNLKIEIDLLLGE